MTIFIAVTATDVVWSSCFEEIFRRASELKFTKEIIKVLMFLNEENTADKFYF